LLLKKTGMTEADIKRAGGMDNVRKMAKQSIIGKATAERDQREGVDITAGQCRLPTR